MTRRELATLACKVIAVWLLAQALMNSVATVVIVVAGVVKMFEAGFDIGELWIIAYTAAPAVGYALVSWLLWAKGHLLADRMVDDDPTPVQLTNLTVHDLLTVSLTVAGVFVTLSGGLGIIRYLAMVATGPAGISTFRQNLNWTSQLVAYAVETGVGLWLTFGSRGIANFIHRFRQTRYDQSTPTA